MKRTLSAAALLLALLLLPATAWAQVPPDECTPVEEQYEGDCTPEVVTIVDPQDDEPSPDGDDPGSSGAIDDADLDDGASFDDDVDDVADASASPAPAAPAGASATAAATASATASASASPTSQSEALPETGGVGGVALAAAVLLVSTGLLARWAVNRR